MKSIIFGTLCLFVLAEAFPEPDYLVRNLVNYAAVGDEKITPEQQPRNNEVNSAGTTTEENGMVCVNMVTMDVKVVYDESLQCVHSFQEKCHNTYITDFAPTQQNKCEDSFDKNCKITYKAKVFEETVEVCRERLEKQCGEENIDTTAPKVCSDYYETACTTKFKNHTAEEDHPECKIVQKQMCVKSKGDLEDSEQNENQVSTRRKRQAAGENDCLKYENWPVQECKVVKRQQTKVVPDTYCEKIKRELCDYPNCKYVKTKPVCSTEVQSDVQRIPEEECDLDPVQHCSMETVLVPKLVEKPNCVKIPQEICHTVRDKPRTEKKPVLKKWCYKKEDMEDQSSGNILRNIIDTKQQSA